MTFGRLLCGTALSVALCVGVTVPAWSQYSQYPRESTPEERAETQELNRGGVRVVRPTPQEAQDYANARAQYESDRARYQRELDEYNARMRDFGRQPNGYDPGPYAAPPDRDGGRYDDRRPPPDAGYDDQDRDDRGYDRGYDERRGREDPYDPPPQAANDPAAQLVPLTRLANPSDELFNTPVIDSFGFSVGHFRRVETRDDGAIVAVITLNAMRTVSVPVEEVLFDPANQVIVSPRITVNGFDAIPSGVLLGSYEE